MKAKPVPIKKPIGFIRFGYPIQSALDAFFALRRENGLRVDNVERIVARLR
jgi:2-methylcitrate dehydratase PrpD